MNTIVMNAKVINTKVINTVKIVTLKQLAAMTGWLVVLLALMQPAVTLAAPAEDRLKLDETSIQGASELPKVLYIVPWKKADVGDKPVQVNRIVDEVLSPVDRDVLNREIRFYEQSQAQ